MTSHLQGRRAGRDATPGPPTLTTPADTEPADTEPADTEPLSPGPVNGFEILAKLTSLPVSTWRYRWEPAGVRHLGPMAQDWHAAFGLGQGDTTIPMVDAHGLLLVAIQALHCQVSELRAEVDQLHQQLVDRSTSP
ncbi:MAG: tail fiber domain-containing protein [Pseudonocardiaceae bacterium]